MSFDGVLRRCQEIDHMARSLVGRRAFDDVHVSLPNPKSPEAGFIRAVSWLYCLYFEAGRVSCIFLQRQGEAYGLLSRSGGEEHMEAVRCLRTELHHNLGFADADLDTRGAADGWRRRACGTVLPETGEQWEQCYQKMVDEAGMFLESVSQVVRRMESSGSECVAGIEEWKQRLGREWPASRFDALVDDASGRLGRQALNVVKFRNRHLGGWRKRLELLDDGFDFEFEATRLIEKTLLEEDGVLLPVTGRDVMEALGVGPGPVVGRLLEEARRHFEVERCGRDALLEYLRRCHLAVGRAEGGG